MCRNVSTGSRRRCSSISSGSFLIAWSVSASSVACVLTCSSVFLSLRYATRTRNWQKSVNSESEITPFSSASKTVAKRWQCSSSRANVSNFISSRSSSTTGKSSSGVSTPSSSSSMALKRALQSSRKSFELSLTLRASGSRRSCVRRNVLSERTFSTKMSISCAAFSSSAYRLSFSSSSCACPSKKLTSVTNCVKRVNSSSLMLPFSSSSKMLTNSTQWSMVMAQVLSARLQSLDTTGNISSGVSTPFLSVSVSLNRSMHLAAKSSEVISRKASFGSLSRLASSMLLSALILSITWRILSRCFSVVTLSAS
mmetsp:Transcript_13273/g.35674  ORF Transcript_13273/g.35674 Transcript_13273/m.35674 type:complete len:311 (-) Transcript_13273:411-1343(-)